jgi:hypothetical protein
LDSFKNDSVDPFKDLLNQDFSNLDEFKDRLNKIELYFLYNRKLKEITVEKALNMFTQINEINIEQSNLDLLKKSFEIYETKFNKYFRDVLNRSLTIDDLIKKAKTKSEEWKYSSIINCDYKLRYETIPKIISILALVLSLNVSQFIEKSKNSYILKDKNKFNEKYFLKPHCIQILGIFKILALDNDKTNKIDNNLAEILTGQGKSWALGLLAGFFNLIGYKVNVACYSIYLSERDQKDFKNYMEPFNFKDVSYDTFKNMCEKKLKFGGGQIGFRKLIENLFNGDKLNDKNYNSIDKQREILLVDEVDVFFSNSFGQTYNPANTNFNDNIRMIQKYIWESIVKNTYENLDQLKTHSISKLHNCSNDKLIQNLIKANFLDTHLDQMVTTADSIFKNWKDYKDKYIIKDNRIHVRDSTGKYVTSTFYGYNNAFCYLKLIFEKFNSFQDVNLENYSYGYVLVNLGIVSYSELPRDYDSIFGVSGSLRNLSKTEKDILDDYKIENISFYPSFFGKQKVKFDKLKDFSIKQTKSQWFDSIVAQTRKIIDENSPRSVLIFFLNEQLLDEFLTYSGDLGMKPYFITSNRIFDGTSSKDYSDENVNKLIGMEYAGHHGCVTLLTKEFGRGIDFQVETKVLELGGIHVIQAFYSTDIKEEIQIRGRTARKDNPGSYELIVCLEHLKKIQVKGYDVEFDTVTCETTYDELDKLRKEKIDSIYKMKIKNIDKYRNSHYKTLEFYRDTLQNCDETNRIEYIKKIKELET